MLGPTYFSLKEGVFTHIPDLSNHDPVLQTGSYVMDGIGISRAVTAGERGLDGDELKLKGNEVFRTGEERRGIQRKGNPLH